MIHGEALDTFAYYMYSTFVRYRCPAHSLGYIHYINDSTQTASTQWLNNMNSHNNRFVHGKKKIEDVCLCSPFNSRSFLSVLFGYNKQFVIESQLV